MGGYLVQPPEKLLIDFLALYESDWHTVSGDPRFARRLPQALGEAGLADLRVSASYDVYFAENARTLFVDVAAARYREKDFVERVLSGGMASLERLEAMRTAWLAAAQQRFAWAAVAHVRGDRQKGVGVQLRHSCLLLRTSRLSALLSEYGQPVTHKPSSKVY